MEKRFSGDNSDSEGTYYAPDERLIADGAPTPGIRNSKWRRVGKYVVTLSWVFSNILSASLGGLATSHFAAKSQLDIGGDIQNIIPHIPAQVIAFARPQRPYTIERKELDNYDWKKSFDYWHEMYGGGRTAIDIPNHIDYPGLGPPIIYTPYSNTTYAPAYTHQLHCVWFLLDAFYEQLRQSQRGREQSYEHVNHCAEYLRQTVLCSGDIALEGSPALQSAGASDETSGFGTSHICRNTEMMNKWMVDHRIYPWRDLSQ